MTHLSEREHVVIHWTIDKMHPAPEFAESIHAFMSDWADGVRAGLQASARSVAAASL